MRVKFSMTHENKRLLRKGIDNEVSKFAKSLTHDTFNAMVDRTPMNTGKTIESWSLSKRRPDLINAEDGEPVEGTNSMAVGSEPNRAWSEEVARHQMGSDRMFVSPYAIYYVTNGASLDSWADSDLEQSKGARAYYLAHGVIPDYNIITGDHGYFNHRGAEMGDLAIEDVKARYHTR